MKTSRGALRTVIKKAVKAGVQQKQVRSLKDMARSQWIVWLCRKIGFHCDQTITGKVLEFWRYAEGLSNQRLIWRVGLNRGLGRLVAPILLVPRPTFWWRPFLLELGLNRRCHNPLSIR